MSHPGWWDGLCIGVCGVLTVGIFKAVDGAAALARWWRS
jgi:hypothetical protein